MSTAATTSAGAGSSAPLASAGTAAASASRGALRLVRAEFLKITTIRTWWVFAILAVVSTGVALLVNISQTSDELRRAAEARAHPPVFDRTPPGGVELTPEDIARLDEEFRASIDIGRILVRGAANIYTSGQLFGLLFMVLLGTVIVTSEFFHQTATTTFLTTPRRTWVVLAKLTAAVGVAVGFWLLSTSIDLAVGSLFFSMGGHAVPLGEWPVLRSVLMNLLAYVVWALLGVGLGILLRSQLAATMTGAAAYLLGFPLALTFFALVRSFVIRQDWVWQWVVAVPSVASQVMIMPEPLQLGFDTRGPAWWVGALVLVGYGVGAGVIGTLVTRRRDIS